ncbi:hypothetical protein CRN72_05920 [Pasteurella multocida]|nr:hypothetical protein CO688_05630 [Pasteurella multocida]ATN17304.1 hypothetical protein CRN72_05920 [Pasteurella multocida]
MIIKSLFHVKPFYFKDCLPFKTTIKKKPYAFLSLAYLALRRCIIGISDFHASAFFIFFTNSSFINQK